MSSKPKIWIGEDLEAISRRAAEIFAESVQKAIQNKRKFSAALSGGETPRRFYQILAQKPYGPNLPWEQIHLFWGDERCVPPEAPQSNYKMVSDLLISKVSIPQTNVHRMRGELPPENAAKEYEQELRSFFGSSDFPKFDFALLGLGDDGHTASLFPKTLVLHETKKRVVGYFVEAAKMPRLTLTIPVFNAARLVLFLVSGSKKAEVLKRIVSGTPNLEPLPAQLIQPIAGILIWLVERASASQLYPDMPT